MSDEDIYYSSYLEERLKDLERQNEVLMEEKIELEEKLDVAEEERAKFLNDRRILIDIIESKGGSVQIEGTRITVCSKRKRWD